MSQTPARVTREDAAVEKIMGIVREGKPIPSVAYGLPEVPRRGRGGSAISPEVEALRAMLRNGEPGAVLTYSTEDASRSAARTLATYRWKNNSPVEIRKRGCRVYITPTVQRIKR